MATHISIATALDKNRIATDAVYLTLIEVDVQDPNNSAVVETLRFANNNESYVWNGVTYLGMAFNFSMSEMKDTAPTATLTCYDFAQIFESRLQAYGQTLDWPTRVIVINTSNPSANAELQHDFEIVGASSDSQNYTMTFTLGAENPLTLVYPPRKQFRNKCYWKFRGPQCQYTGALATCDFMLHSSNGCIAHGNQKNFSGFPGINQKY